jgi:hypothetical protein
LSGSLLHSGIIKYYIRTGEHTIERRGRTYGRVNLEMADWWETTLENYRSHVSKDRILEVVGEAVSPQWRKRW